jgi:periplasmic divalent cation tolerance protein
VSAILVLSTCPDRASAQRIASVLVERGLAACVSLLPGVTSFYRWQGALHRSEEIQLLIKTRAERYPDLEREVLALHPYELPELIAVQVAAGLDRYLDWIGASTVPPADS